MKDYQTLEFGLEDGIATITINRPEVLNALNGQVFRELESIFLEMGLDPEVRGIILTGKGEKAFAAGSDVKEFASCSFLEAREVSVRNNAAQQVIANIGKPTIAALNGFTLGGGLELAMCCDIRIASHNAKFGQPEISLGFIPGGGGTQRLARIVGEGRAKELIFSGKIIDAPKAYEIGLVNLVTAPEDLLAEAEKMARSFSNKSMVILGFAKEAVQRGLDMDILSGLKLETELWAESFATEDHHEGISAFLEKRKAQFKDR